MGGPAARHRLLIAALLVVPLLPGCDALDKPAMRQYEAAMTKWNAGEHRAAVQLYEALAKEHPWSPRADDALYWSGLTRFLYLGDTEKGLQTLRLLLSKYPRRDSAPGAQYLIAQIYELGYNDFERAIIEYERAAAYRNREVREKSLYSLAENLMRLGRVDEAKASWERQVTEFPRGALAPFGYFRLGTTAFSQGGLEEAQAFYRRVLELTTDTDLILKTRYAMANCLEAAEQLDEALELYRAIAPAYPNREAIEIKIKALETRIAKKSY